MVDLRVQVDVRRNEWHEGFALDANAEYRIVPDATDRYRINGDATQIDFRGEGNMDGTEIDIPKNPIRVGGLVVLVWHHQPDSAAAIPEIIDFPPGKSEATVRTSLHAGSMLYVIADKANTGLHP